MADEGGANNTKVIVNIPPGSTGVSISFSGSENESSMAEDMRSASHKRRMSASAGEDEEDT